MLINKITIGFVTQTFDTETGKYTGQEFFAGGEVTYEYGRNNENLDGQELSITALEEIGKNDNFGPYAKNGPYLPFDMVQPKEYSFDSSH